MAQAKLEVIIEAQNQAKRQLENLSNQLNRLGKDQQELADRTENAKQSFLGFTASISAGVLAANLAQSALSSITRATTGFIKSSIDTALSVERIAATLPVLAKNTGKTEEEIRRIIFAIREENKSIREATEVTRGIVLAGLDEVDALKLIAVARDVGATVGRTSADVNRLILESFQTLNPGILKQVGLNISLRETYRNLAETLGKNVAELTTIERQQGLLNAIFIEGDKFAGAYSAAMTTVQKVTNSVRDASEDVKFVLGSLLSAGFFPVVRGALDGIRAFRAWAITSQNELRPELQLLADRIGTIVVATFNFLVATTKAVAEAFIGFLNILRETGIIKAIFEIFKDLATFFEGTLLPAIKFLTGDTDTLKVIIGALLAVIAIGIVAVLVPLAAAIIKITLVAVGLAAVIRVAIAVLSEFFFQIITFKDQVVASWNAIKVGFDIAFDAIKAKFTEVFTSIRDFFANIMQSIRDTAFGTLDSIISKIQDVISRITAIPRSIGGGISGAVGAVRGFVGLQEGGVVTRPTVARIAERGPEAVIPLRRFAGLGGGNAITVNINGAVFSDDAERLGKQVGDAILRRLGLNMRIF